MRVSCKKLMVAAVAILFTACTSVEKSYIDRVIDLPLKTTAKVSSSWQDAPLRANSNYLLFGARTAEERQNRIGDYYYVRWYDAELDKPVQLKMQYTQALTASQVLTQTIDLPAPREDAGIMLNKFSFNGSDRRRRGDILSWKIELYVDGELRDSRQSYLWDTPVKKK